MAAHRLESVVWRVGEGEACFVRARTSLAGEEGVMLNGGYRADECGSPERKRARGGEGGCDVGVGHRHGVLSGGWSRQ